MRRLAADARPRRAAIRAAVDALLERRRIQRAGGVLQQRLHVRLAEAVVRRRPGRARIDALPHAFELGARVQRVRRPVEDERLDSRERQRRAALRERDAAVAALPQPAVDTDEDAFRRTRHQREAEESVEVLALELRLHVDPVGATILAAIEIEEARLRESPACVGGIDREVQDVFARRQCRSTRASNVRRRRGS
jgi:hypothetical protein